MFVNKRLLMVLTQEVLSECSVPIQRLRKFEQKALL